MRKVKRVEIEERVPVRLSIRDRELILNHTLADPELTDRLESAVPVRSRITAYYTLYELEYLQGFIAAEANHAKTKKIQRELDKLYDRIKKVEDSYVDELSPEWLQKLAT